GECDTRDRALGRSRQYPAAGRAQRDAARDHSDDRQQHGEDTPHGEFPPHPASIDNGVGIERHESAPSMNQAATLAPPATLVHGRIKQTQLWQTASKRRRCALSSSRYSSVLSAFSPARLSAVPRMSPRVAPESEEPYCAIASFSSCTSSALIETETLRARRSI